MNTTPAQIRPTLYAIYGTYLMKYIIYIFLFILLSCTNSESRYIYNGVTVSRVDKDGEVRFYYGDINDENAKHPSVKVEYSGFNSGVDGFLLFKSDKVVEVINYGGGYFTQSKDAGKQITIKDYDNHELDSLINQKPANRMNLIRISDVRKLEEQRNREHRTGVQVVYD